MVLFGGQLAISIHPWVKVKRVGAEHRVVPPLIGRRFTARPCWPPYARLGAPAREQGATSEHDALFQPKLVDVDVDRGRF